MRKPALLTNFSATTVSRLQARTRSTGKSRITG
jgi:hypothetical protein